MIFLNKTREIQMINTNQIITNIKSNADTLVAHMNNNILGPWDVNFIKNICSNINELAFEVGNKNPQLYNELQDIKSNLFIDNNFVNVYTLARLVQIMRSYDYISTNDFWQFIHPKKLNSQKTNLRTAIILTLYKQQLLKYVQLFVNIEKKKDYRKFQAIKI